MYKTIKRVCTKDNCTGCTACVSICPVNAIKIIDDLYAYNAIIEPTKCIKCEKCFKVCPQNNSPKMQEPIEWKQGWVRNQEERKRSSSGGYATAIAKAFIESGGLVCACVQVENEFRFILIDQIDKLKRVSGSKYVKSNPIGIFLEVKEQLKKSKKVLFIGLPCQVAGIINYLGNDITNKLYTIDLICHGTPSPKLLSLYLQEEFNKNIGDYLPLRFRKDIHFGLYEGNKKLLKDRLQDKYTLAFLEGIDYTESCYNCKYASIKRVSDITLGDSWGTEYIEEMKDGISLALCQNFKGIELLKMANVHLYDVDIKKATLSNRQLISPTLKPAKRKLFFNVIIKSNKFSRAIWVAYPKESMKYLIKKMLYFLHLL